MKVVTSAAAMIFFRRSAISGLKRPWALSPYSAKASEHASKKPVSKIEGSASNRSDREFALL